METVVNAARKQDTGKPIADNHFPSLKRLVMTNPHLYVGSKA